MAPEARNATTAPKDKRSAGANGAHLLCPFSCQVPNSRQLEIVEGYQRVTISYHHDRCCWERVAESLYDMKRWSSVRHSTRSRVTTVTWSRGAGSDGHVPGGAGQGRAWLADCSETDSGLPHSTVIDVASVGVPPSITRVSTRLADCGIIIRVASNNSHRGPWQTSTDIFAFRMH